jgi:hypothetical protein
MRRAVTPEVAEIVSVDALHVYGTTVLDPEQQLSLSLIAIPRQALPGDPTNIEEVALALDATIERELPTPAASFLPHAIASLLPDQDADSAFTRLNRFLETPPVQGFESEDDVRLMSFAAYCAFAPIVPLEESRLRGIVAVALIGAGGSVAAALVTAGAPIIIALGAGAATVLVFTVTLAGAEHIYNKLAPKG